MYKILRRITEATAPEIIEFAQELIRTPSPSYCEKNVADLVEKKMTEIGFDQVMRDEFGNVVGVIYGSENEPTIMLNGHMDTVAADCGGTWQGDPYEASIQDGKLIGLGASDCKGGIAAQLGAAAILKRALLPLRGNLVVTASVAEENGTSVGVRRLLEKTLPEMDLTPDLVLLGEPTSLGVYYGHDGWVEVEVGIEAAADTQLEKAAEAVHASLQSECAQYGPSNHLEEMIVEGPVYETLNVGRRAVLRINRRLTAPLESTHVVNQIQRNASLTAQAAGGVAVKVDVRERSQRLYTGLEAITERVTHAWETNPFNPRLQRACQCLTAAGCTARPGKWRLGRLGMGTAGAVITREFNIPTIGYGPGDEEQAHRPDEFVDTNMLVEAAHGTAAIVHGMVGIPVLGWTVDEI